MQALPVGELRHAVKRPVQYAVSVYQYQFQSHIFPNPSVCHMDTIITAAIIAAATKASSATRVCRRTRLTRIL